MRNARRHLASAIVLLVGIALAAPADALVGPDPGPHDSPLFRFNFVRQGDGTVVDQVTFDWSVDGQTGWDFGDRAGYACAFAEYLLHGQVAFRIEFQRAMVQDDAAYVFINDKFGSPESSDVGGSHPFTCGVPGVHGRGGESVVWDGSDHFPHHSMVHLFENGAEVLAPNGGPALDLMRDDCARGYWVPGDEPGEVWLWWDEDGPTEHAPGMPLPCGGGPIEPVPVARGFIPPQYLAEGIEVCVMDELAGDRCETAADAAPPPAEHPSAITLRLRGGLRAIGHVLIPDGASGCLAAREVVVERHGPSRWTSVGRDLTANGGRFSARLPDRSGAYRARVREGTLATGDVCHEAVSDRVVHRR